LTNAIKGKGKDEAWIDYLMSEKFGLDWKKYDHKRMNDFILIDNIYSNLKNQ
jgi:hypothetical protein